MKLTEKQVEELIIEIAGNEGLSVYGLLKGRENVNEFLIAEKLKMTINQIRNIFYKFQANNLIISTSKKDRKKGWYIYFFTFNYSEAGSAFLRMKREKIVRMEQNLEREKSHQYYVCPNRDMRATIENAMEHSFTCVECGQLLIPENNRKAVARLEAEILEARKEIVVLEKQAEEDRKKILADGEKVEARREERIKKKVEEARENFRRNQKKKEKKTERKKENKIKKKVKRANERFRRKQEKGNFRKKIEKKKQKFTKKIEKKKFEWKGKKKKRFDKKKV